jgi:tellurite resistance protein TerC
MPLSVWIAFAAVIITLLVVDLKVVGRRSDTPSLKSSAAWSAFWTALALAFTAVLAVFGTGQQATEYLTGFLIEKSLSLDNLFVFAMLLAYFQVPAGSQRRVLIWGIAGAIVLRAIFIFAGAAALEAFHFTIYVFGAFLILTAVKMARHSEVSGPDIEQTLVMKTVRRFFPIAGYDGEKFFTRLDGRRAATPLLAALVMVAAFDVLFAVDSVPAIFAVSRDTFVVFAANAFSLLGMASLYFLLAGMLDRFCYLSHGLAAILAFVGTKMLISDLWHPPHWLSLTVIIGILAAAVAASALWPKPAHTDH